MPDRPEMIGVLVDELDGEYQIAVVGGVVDAAREAGVNVIVFAGGVGGDEFAILMPRTDLEGAARVGERILAELDGQQLTTITGTIPIECSLGFGMLPPYAGRSPDPSKPLGPAWFTIAAEALIASANAALYRARKLGGDKVSRGEPVSWPELPG